MIDETLTLSDEQKLEAIRAAISAMGMLGNKLVADRAGAMALALLRIEWAAVNGIDWRESIPGSEPGA